MHKKYEIVFHSGMNFLSEILHLSYQTDKKRVSSTVAVLDMKRISNLCTCSSVCTIASKINVTLKIFACPFPSYT